MLVGGGDGGLGGGAGGGKPYLILRMPCLTLLTIIPIDYDAKLIIQDYLRDDDNSDEYINVNLSSFYFDAQSFINKFKNTKHPIMLSLNVQSLQSKYCSA